MDMKTTTIWITQDHWMHDFPSVNQYEAVRIGTDSVTVRQYGGERVIRKADGRRWFTDRAKMIAY